MQYFLTGAPGAGKTTIALHLATKRKIPHISYRKLVLDYISKSTRRAKRVKELWLNFKPFLAEDAFEILYSNLKTVQDQSFVLDGYPKTAEEAQYLADWLKVKDKREKSTFFLDLDHETIHERLQKRFVCSQCSYVSAHPNPNSILVNECPYCHIALIQRKDDIPERITLRIERYLQEKQGILQGMAEMSVVNKIDASKEMAEVISDVLENAGIESKYNLVEAERGARMLVEGLGLDLADPNMIETPGRIARALAELCKGVEPSTQDQIKELLGTSFPTKYKGMIILEPIDAISLCSHHLLPVHYEVLFGYLPSGLSLGFSKIVKAIKLIASKPSLQEDFTQEVIDTFNKILEPEGIMVVVRGEHGCMSLRGERSANVNITSALRGVFKTSERTRNEFLTLAKFSHRI